jgi:hypothetical protein
MPKPMPPTFDNTCPRCHTDLTPFPARYQCPVCERLTTVLPGIIADITADLTGRLQANPGPVPAIPAPTLDLAELRAELAGIRATGTVPEADTYRLHALGVRW